MENFLVRLGQTVGIPLTIVCTESVDGLTAASMGCCVSVGDEKKPRRGSLKRPNAKIYSIFPHDTQVQICLNLSGEPTILPRITPSTSSSLIRILNLSDSAYVAQDSVYDNHVSDTVAGSDKLRRATALLRSPVYQNSCVLCIADSMYTLTHVLAVIVASRDPALQPAYLAALADSPQWRELAEVADVKKCIATITDKEDDNTLPAKQEERQPEVVEEEDVVIAVSDVKLTEAPKPAAADANSSLSRLMQQACEDVVKLSETPLSRGGSKVPVPKAYRLVKVLRKTILGEVHLGVDISAETMVAVKLSRTNLKREDMLEDPSRELEMLRVVSSDFGHRNVVRLLDEHNDVKRHQLWTVMEFANDGELFDHVVNVGKLDEKKICRPMFRQIVLGVQHIHKKRIAHLDLSLENVLLADGEAKICDFGQAQFLFGESAEKCGKGHVCTVAEWGEEEQQQESNEHEKKENKKNREGGYKRVLTLHGPLSSKKYGIQPGKTGYMAPEVFAGRAFNPIKADLYCLGVMLFLMLLGFPPYKLPDPSDARFKYIYQGRCADVLKAWNVDCISKEATDLISALICPERLRLKSCAEVLQHAFFQ